MRFADVKIGAEFHDPLTEQIFLKVSSTQARQMSEDGGFGRGMNVEFSKNEMVLQDAPPGTIHNPEDETRV